MGINRKITNFLLRNGQDFSFLNTKANHLSCIISLGYLVPKWTFPWSFHYGLISELQHNYQDLQDKTRKPQKHICFIWQYPKYSQFGNSCLWLNCWTWIDSKCNISNWVYDSMHECVPFSLCVYFSLLDNYWQRWSMTLENKHWGVYWLHWLPLGTVMKKTNRKLFSQVVFYQLTLLFQWSKSL